jgi:hypothetical protein
MNLSTEQIAELLAGIVRSQQAIIDAIESESGGWRNTHLLPKLNTASNMRLATPRLIDIPARVLLRSQGRVPMDVATIARALEEAAGGITTPLAAAPLAASAISAPASATPVAATSGNTDSFFDS